MKRLVKKTVEKNPGISFSQLKQKTGLSNGELQYYLRKSSTIRNKDAYMPVNFCRNCALSGFCDQKCMLKELRKDEKRRMVEKFGSGKTMRHIGDEVGKDTSTVSYHLSPFIQSGLIEKGEISRELQKALDEV
ncbi:hypothetical protein GLU60_01005 [Nanohaloarchaea archaeon H01]|nr:hypothetical protein [Nanohaloarchaea archaeon H01]